MKNLGICRLCERQKQLIKAHIIPDFFYRRARGSSDKLRTFDAVKSYKGVENIRCAVTGVYDRNILCRECDNYISQNFEDYASKLLFGGLPIAIGEKSQLIKDNNGVLFSQISNVHYVKFKLFLLSILWRASISTQKFFEAVQLGPHENVIRRMLIKQDAKSVGDYPMLILNYQLASRGKEVTELIGQPLRKRIENRIAYSFLLFGNVVAYLVSQEHNTPSSSLFMKSTINAEGEMKWIHVQGDAMAFLASVIGLSK